MDPRAKRLDALGAAGWIIGSLGALSGLLGAVLAGFDSTSLVGVFSGTGCCLLGAFIIDRQPANRAAWAFLAGGVALVAFSLCYGYTAGQVRHGNLTVGGFAASGEIIGAFAGAGLPFFQFLFPDGRLPSRRWRPVFIAYLIGWVACPIAVGIAIWPHRAPGIVAHNGPVDIALPPDLGSALTVIGITEAFAGISMAIGIVSIAVRLRQPAERRRVLLALWGIGLTAVLIAATAGLDAFGFFTAESVTSLCAPLPLFFAVTVAMRRHQLFDVERLVGQTLTYATVTLLLLSLYAGVAIGLGSLTALAGIGSSLAVAAGTLAVAAAFRPLLRVVRAAVDRRFDRRTWLAIQEIEAFTRDLRAGKVEAASIGPVLLRAAGDPSGSVVYLDGAQTIDAFGAPVSLGDVGADRFRRTVLAGAVPVAVVELDGRLGDEPRLVQAVLSAAALPLENAALHAQAAVRLVAINESRTRMVEADDSNWRRIERDLHDGAQQRLVALALRLRIAERENAGAAVAQVLGDAVTELRGTVNELRDLTRSVLPPVLADEGLLVALRTAAARLPLPVVLEVPGERYPALVEATAWFVSCEGMANAAKHADASSLRIALRRTGDCVVLQVADDGAGGAVLTPGGGLQGLADRVAAVGGRLTFRSPIGGGTCIEAELPCTS
ncbi:histidine kinase [Kribbella sp. NPDC006257]|uniref:sensor histidine kinase n=1 Tax=Kribbella sp. NPDC006257 TaxID=3156738 RepID=UPI0033B033D8